MKQHLFRPLSLFKKLYIYTYTFICMYIYLYIHIYIYSLFMQCTHLCMHNSQTTVSRLLITGMTSQSGTPELTKEYCAMFLIRRRQNFAITLSPQDIFFFAGQKTRCSIMIIFLFPSSLLLSNHLLPFQSQTFQSSYSKNVHLAGVRIHPWRT